MSLTIPEFKKARILVIGDIMLDQYWLGATSRISPEAPVPIVKIGSAENKLGGAANVAHNLAALGCEVSLRYCRQRRSGENHPGFAGAIKY